jgi:ABC-2 type transport system permease protein
MVVVFGSLFMSNVFTPKKSKESKGAQESLQQFIMPEFVPPLVAYGAMSMALLSIGQFVGNQFGFDRGGFRALVLSAAPRRQILLGKNLAFAPLGLGLGLLVSVLVQVIYPVRIDVFLAEVPQLLSMYLLFCMVANWLSIMAPMSIRAGTMKPVNPKVFTVLLHVFSVLLYPVVLAPVLLPLVAHLLVEEVAGIRYLPVDLVLSVLLCALVFFLYQAVLTSEGQLLRRRELKILEAATAKTE